jgi:DNA-directed RNA polymerase specialized sigma24 family protein
MNSISNLAELARRALLGEGDAVEALMRELSPTIVRTARLVVGPASSVGEDAAQEALIDVNRAIGTLRDPQTVVAWAMRITVARALKLARRERLKSRLWASSPSDVRADGIDTSATAAVIREAFYRLPPKLRAVAVLRLYLEFSEAETARATHSPTTSACMTTRTKSFRTRSSSPSCGCRSTTSSRAWSGIGRTRSKSP